jgi:hypothetical protein
MGSDTVCAHVSIFDLAELRSWQLQRKTYTLIPTRIRKGNQISIGLQRLRLLNRRGGNNRPALCLWRGGRWRGWWCCYRRGFHLLGIQRPDEELRLVLLQDALIVILPELLGCVLASDSRENLFATWSTNTVSWDGLWEGD